MSLCVQDLLGDHFKSETVLKDTFISDITYFKKDKRVKVSFDTLTVFPFKLYKDLLEHFENLLDCNVEFYIKAKETVCDSSNFVLYFFDFIKNIA